MISKFENDEIGYLSWIGSHPDGYVLNANKTLGGNYAVIHKPSCFSISKYQSEQNKGGFTERNYIKVCSDTLPELKAWINKNIGLHDGHYCAHCNPK